MNRKIIILTLTLMLSLTLLSCVSASDVNETVTVDEYDNQIVIEDTAVCEDKLDDVQTDSPITEITHENEDPVIENIIINNNTYSTCEVEEVVNDVVYDEKEIIDLDIENYEIPVDKHDNNINNSQFCDINLESDKELDLDATFNNNHILLPSSGEIDFSLGSIAYFETAMLKMDDFSRSLFKDGKFKNSLEIKHELEVYILDHHNSENILDCDIIICSNKTADNFAYSINNSIVGDEISVIYCGFSGAFFVYLHFIDQNYLFFNNIVIDCDFTHFMSLSCSVYYLFPNKTERLN